MLILHALLVIFLICVFFFVDARPHRIEDVREPDRVQKTGTGDTGIRDGYNRQRIEASPNAHLSLSLHHTCHPLTTSLLQPPHFANLHHKPSTLHPHQLITLTYNTQTLIKNYNEL